MCQVWQRNMQRCSLYRVHKVNARTDGRKDARTEPRQRNYIPAATRCAGTIKPNYPLVFHKLTNVWIWGLLSAKWSSRDGIQSNCDQAITCINLTKFKLLIDNDKQRFFLFQQSKNLKIGSRLTGLFKTNFLGTSP